MAAAVRETRPEVLLLSTLVAPLGYQVAEAAGIPWAGVFLQPLYPTGDFGPVLVGGRSAGRTANRLMGRITEAAARPLYRAPIRGLRAELGLPRVGTRRLQREQQHRWPTFHGFSPSVVPRPTDWPASQEIVGYWWPAHPPGRPSPPDRHTLPGPGTPATAPPATAPPVAAPPATVPPATAPPVGPQPLPQSGTHVAPPPADPQPLPYSGTPVAPPPADPQPVPGPGAPVAGPPALSGSGTPVAEVEAFLAAGPPPVFVGFGSMAPGHGGRLAGPVLAAVRAAGVRAVVQAGWSGLRAGDEPGVLSVGALPHDWLFPRMAAVVHHAGAGTTAAGLRAGVPAVAVPVLADQPFWAWRLHALGVSPRPLPFSRLTADRLAAALTEATTDPRMRARAAALAADLAREDGAARIIEWLAELGEAASRATAARPGAGHSPRTTAGPPPRTTAGP
ncbi:hypothetical protein Asp14428_78450 [Actinoplanes sp. NBRC 14428]|nr:hypothetical protein Asp14428_78450 [Actinoplanes sp. NBRC 14428]